MKSKIITVAIIATTLATGAFVYADSQTGTGITSRIGNGFFHKLGGDGLTGSGGEFGPCRNGGKGFGMDFERKGFDGNGLPGIGFGGMMGPKSQLTQDEITKLTSMTDTEKKAFFETKMKAEKAKLDARENVIDKLLNGEVLNDAEKAIQAEIKADRAKMKEERAKLEAKMTEAKPLLEKLRSGQTLTEAEKAKLDELKLGGNGMKSGFGKGGKGRGRGMMRGE